MSELKNAHGSLLGFIAAIAEQLGIEPVNLDAIADEVDLPEGDFIGIQSFSMSSANDSQPLTSIAGMLTVAVKNDANNMRLMDYLDKVYYLAQPEHLMPLYSMETQQIIGDMKFKGTTRLMPVTRNGTLAIQSITFQAALQYVE